MAENTNMSEKESDFMCHLNTVMKSIYTSCDPEGTDSIKVSELVNYIKPYMQEDLSSLESLKNSLDPKNEDICVSSQTFYDAMNEWAKKMSSSDEEDMFNRTPNQLDFIEEKELPYVQSTPRASWGQKFLNRSMDLLNLSNVSTYSTNGNKTTGTDLAMLEEKIQMQQHEIHKCKSDLTSMKMQLTAFEEQNEILQTDLQKVNKKLRSEQLQNEQLQKQILELEELKEEINNYKKKVEDLTKKNTAAEREHERLLTKIDQLEIQREKLESKYEDMSKREQEAKKQIFEIKLEMDMKEININDLVQLNESLKNQLNENKDLIDFLRSENEQLTCQNTSLNKALKDKRLSKTAYKTILDSSEDSATSIYSKFNVLSPQNNQLEVLPPAEGSPGVSPICNSPMAAPSLRKQVLTRGASTPHGKVRCSELNPKRKILSSESEQSSPKENSNDTDDSYTRHLESMKHLKKQFSAMDSLQVEISKVNERVCICDRLLKERDDLNEKLESQNADFSELKRKLEEVELNNRNFEDEVSNLKKQRQDLESNLAIVQKDLDNARWENKDLLHAKSCLVEKLERLEIDKAEIESQLSLVQNERYTLMDEVRKHELHLAEVKEALRLNTERVEELKKKCDDLEGVERKLETTKAVLLEKEKMIEGNLEWKKMIQEQLQGEILEKSVKIQRLNDENSDLRVKMEDLRGKLEEVVNNKEKLDNVYKIVLETTEQIEAHLIHKTGVVAELEKLNGQLSASLQDRIKEIEMLRDDLKADLETKNSLWKQLKKLSHENKALFEEHKVLKEQKNEFNKVLVDYNKCKLDLDELRKEIEELCKLKDEYQRKIEDKESMVVVQKNLIVSLENELKDREKKIVGLEANKLRCSELLVLSKKTLTEKCQEIAQLKNKSEVTDKNLDAIICKLSNNKNLIDEDRCQTLNNFITIMLQQLESIVERILQVHKPPFNLEDPPLKKLDTILDSFIQKFKFQAEDESRKPVFGKHAIKIDRLQNRLTTLEEKLDSTKKRYDQVVKEKDELRSLNKKLQAQIVEVTTKNEDLKTIHNKFHTQLQELNQLKHAFDIVNQEKLQLQENVQTLTQEIADCHTEVIQLNLTIQENNRQFTNQIMGYQRTMEQFKHEKYTLMTSEDQLREQLESKNKIIEKLHQDLDNITTKNKDCNDIEEKLKGTVCLLKSSEMELNLIKGKIVKEKEELDKTIKLRTDVFANQRQVLTRACDQLMSVLQRFNEDEDFGKLMKNTDFRADLEVSDEEVQKLVEQIKTAVVLLELMAIKFPRHMELAETELEEKIGSRLSAPDSHNTVKKFTLRAPRLVVTRPDSPDSPSVDLEGPKEDTPTINLRSNCQDSPDSDGKKLHKYDDTFLSAEGDSMKADEDEERFSSAVDLEKPFPHITDTFLEQLGLHETSELKKLSKEETEKVFTALVIQLSIDSNDLKNRQQKQKEQLLTLEEKIFRLLKEVSFRLRDHKCGTLDSVKPIFILLEEAKMSVEKAIASAAQYGVVSYEGRMMKCWNLVTNYTAMLRREKESSGSPSTKDSPSQTNIEGPRKRRSNNVNSETETANKLPLSRTRKPMFVMSVVTTFAIFFAILSFIQMQCRMVSSDEQPCPLDFLMRKTINGPPPF